MPPPPRTSRGAELEAPLPPPAAIAAETKPTRFAGLDEAWRSQVRRHTMLATYDQLGLDLASHPAGGEQSEQDVMTYSSVYRSNAVPPAVQTAAISGTTAQLLQRLTRAGELAASARAHEQEANTSVFETCLSLLCFEGVQGLHQIVGVHRVGWWRRVLKCLDVDADWYTGADDEALRRRAEQMGVTYRDEGGADLEDSILVLLQAQAQWFAARQVRDVLIRHLYPQHLNQPGVQAATGLTQAQVWQILNPDYRRQPSPKD